MAKDEMDDLSAQNAWLLGLWKEVDKYFDALELPKSELNPKLLWRSFTTATDECGFIHLMHPPEIVERLVKTYPDTKLRKKILSLAEIQSAAFSAATAKSPGARWAYGFKLGLAIGQGPLKDNIAKYEGAFYANANEGKTVTKFFDALFTKLDSEGKLSSPRPALDAVVNEWKDPENMIHDIIGYKKDPLKLSDFFVERDDRDQELLSYKLNGTLKRISGASLADKIRDWRNRPKKP